MGKSGEFEISWSYKKYTLLTVPPPQDDRKRVRFNKREGVQEVWYPEISTGDRI